MAHRPSWAAVHQREGVRTSKAVKKEWAVLVELRRQARVGQSCRKNNTSPDVTWTKAVKNATWGPQEDTIGSEHLPIEIHIKAAEEANKQYRS